MIIESGCRTTSIGNGWTPVISLVVRNDGKTIQEVTDWAGGTGAKPVTGIYIGDNGYVTNINDATPVDGPTGPQGVTGPQGPDGPPGDAPILTDDWFAL